MTVLTNRLNTETGSMLKHEGGTITQAEKERFGQSKMIRYVSGIDQMIYPIAFIKNKIPMAKRSIVCSYTKEGRAPIHTELNLNQIFFVNQNHVFISFKSTKCSWYFEPYSYMFRICEFFSTDSQKISDSVTRTAPSSNKRPDKNTQYHKKDARENQ